MQFAWLSSANMMIGVLVFALAACTAWAGLVKRADPTSDGWKRINLREVCYEGKGNRYGTVLNYGSGRLVGAIKLVYKHGTIRCVSNTAYNSRWGCHHYWKNYPLDVVITDKNNEVIYPKSEFIRHSSGKWYYLPFTNEQHSDELVFTDFCQPFYFPQYAEMRIWYGEDLTGWSEGDNQGRVCVDVYARFM
ncbi:uncharacterized protein LOC116619460 [Nematostella vectensis]|uniref:uncharacterized protein LOC116619460 n=1 Tax=Nematostella vectensis TaxID=45351 RepID=UPI00138FF4F9|nr:uncharacterized protein LOC116619460 [Nematostella vectensis]